MKKKSGKATLQGEIKKNKRGFGFIIVEGGDDIFVPSKYMTGVMNGDVVEAELVPKGYQSKSQEAIIKKIVKRKYTKVVGSFQKNKSFGFVIPDDKNLQDDIFIRKDNFHGAETGDKVEARIIQYPSETQSAEGKIVHVIAKKDQPGADVLALICSHGLSNSFPRKVETEAKTVAGSSITEEISKRLDLRDEMIVTIDGPAAKDLDDGVSIKKLPNGNYLLGVHIADVSHYVKEDSVLDREALKRGTSVYLINRIIPMLPKALSNGACSLNPEEDKLTLSCMMEIDSQGQVVNHDIKETIINSKGRLVYDQVSDLLEGKEEGKIFKAERPQLAENLLLMGELADILRVRRKKLGSLDFDIDEAEIEVDDEENPISVVAAERRSANRLIEEFMLVANEAVAEHFFWMDYPFVYRVHERPDVEKMIDLRSFLANFGVKLKGKPDNIFPQTLAEIISEMQGKPYENIVNRVILRTMKKAYYSTACDGHFGLGFKYYCHFTSPIRRYPDLMIHRIIKGTLRGEMTERKIPKYRADAENAADISSLTERKAQELEREVEKMKKAQFILTKIGQEFTGIVSGVTEFGIYVELENTIEGMVSARELKRPYQLGEKVKIIVKDARPHDREIDFSIAEE